MNWRFYRAS